MLEFCYTGSISDKQNSDCLTEVVEHFVNLMQKIAVKDKTLGECFLVMEKSVKKHLNSCDHVCSSVDPNERTIVAMHQFRSENAFPAGMFKALYKGRTTHLVQNGKKIIPEIEECPTLFDLIAILGRD
jgi:hypothetical protein